MYGSCSLTASRIISSTLSDISTMFWSNKTSIKSQPNSGCPTRSPFVVSSRFLRLDFACCNTVFVARYKAR